MKLDLSEPTQANRLKKLLGTVIDERNQELAHLQGSTKVPSTVKQVSKASIAHDHEIIYMELPTIPLRIVALALTAVAIAVLLLL